MLDAVTIDQLRMLVAVVDNGSFTAGAKSVQRAQSAVSQAIATLEFQLDLKLFDRTTRKPTLTAEGAAVLADARAVIDRAQALRDHARALAGGVEANVTLALSMLAPIATVAGVLAEFDAQFEATNLDVLIQEASGPLDVVAEGAADIGVVGGFNIRGAAAESVTRTVLGPIGIKAVVASDHPLGAIKGTVALEDVREYRQLTSASARGVATANPLSSRVWPVADQSVRRLLIERGFGWGIMPESVVEEALEAGTLREIDLAFLRGGALVETLYAVHRSDQALGPAGRWLVERLAAALGEAG